METGRGRVCWWEGPSTITGDPVVVLITHLVDRTGNTKLGDMAQAWIVPRPEASDASLPLDVVREGRDASVCGTCRHRPALGGACYVSVARGPQRVAYGHRRDPYDPPPEDLALLAVKPLRIGAWGDPAAVPLEVWQPLLEALRAAGQRWTAYTHRWAELDPEAWGWCMASVDTPAEARRAQVAGWRTFRVRTRWQRLLPGEVVCPAAQESRHADRATCASCRLCDGRRQVGRPPNVAIRTHGAAYRRHDGGAQLTLLGGGQ